MKPPTASRVPAVVDALVAKLEAALPGVTVLDGPTPQVPRADVVAVGVGDESVMVSAETAPGLGTAYVEILDVVCSAWSWSGSTKLKPRRDRVAELLAAVDTALRADPRLGGVCDRVTLGSEMSWTQENGPDGASCAVGFTVRAKTSR